jgi:alpha-L-rhamnosidase
MFRYIAIVTLYCLPAVGFTQKLKISYLRSENKVNPIAIDAKQPLLSWELESTQRNVLQKAYRILVADDSVLLQKNIGNIWDSKKAMSSASINVLYGGKPLQSAKYYYWKVQVWDNKNSTANWSNIAYWQMGLLAKSDWKNAQWIAYDKIADSNITVLPIDGKADKFNANNILPLLRKDFAVEKSLMKATMFISGLGHFELSLNGKKVGDHFLDAGWVKYDKEALYVGFDVTNQIKEGTNAVGVMLGNGFYYVPPVKGRFRKLKSSFGYPKMICRMLLQYSDGTTENIVSDTSWKAAPGPITFSSIYGGEDYNANLEQAGWDSPGFNDQGWRQALLVDGPPALNPQLSDPLKIFEQFTPQESHALPNGDWVFDLGQNASGIVELQVQGNKGDTVKITPGELLKDSAITQKASGGPFYFQYILKGDGIEKWQPRFTYYGFRYLQVKGASPKDISDTKTITKIISIKGLHTRNAAARVGEFSSSNELFNKTDKLIDWAIKSNMVSVFTDCPHREKLGWLEEAHLMGSSVRYNYDIANLGRKVVNDMMNSQLDNGLVPEIAPEYVHFTWGGTMFRDSPEWGSSSILLPWYLHEWYGDKAILAQAYPMMKKYIKYLQRVAKNNILSQGLGDWYDLGPNPPGVSQLTPMGVTGTAIYYYDLTVLVKIANMLGHTEDAKNFSQLAAEVKAAFNNTFFNKETKHYATASQTANAMAIYMKLVPDEYRSAVVNNLVQGIKDSSYRLTAGDIGYRYVIRALEEEGRSDVIFQMNNRSDVPGYGYQLAKGATALTESWQALPTVSNNHFMLGHLMEWFYSGLAGIRQAANSTAFKQIEIHPEIVGDVNSAKASYHSPYGIIESSWKKTADSFELEVKIPANTSAIVYLPAGGSSIIRETISNNEKSEIKATRNSSGRAVIKTGSGNYHFVVADK